MSSRDFEVPAVKGSAVGPAPRVAAPGKVFRDHEPGQTMLLPPSEHLARFVDELVELHLDLGPVYAAHSNLKGFPPYEPRMMLKVALRDERGGGGV